MSPTTIDWCMLGLGVLGLFGVVWLQRVRSTAQRTGKGLGARSLRAFTIFVGGVLGFEGLLQFIGTAKWQAMALGLAIGGVFGALTGRWWILRHPKAEAVVNLHGSSGWLISWRFQLLLLVALFVIAILPPFAPTLALISSRTNLQAAVQEGLAGLFIVFGLFLTMTLRRRF